MGSRIQVILDDESREAFRRQAERDGVSLSAWLREAGLRRLAEATAERQIRSVTDLRDFFASLPDRDDERPEPGWDEHVRVMERSRASGSEAT